MRNIRSILVIFACLSVYQAGAQQNSYARANLQIWENAKARTVAVAQAMPADKYDYQPMATVMSFGQQMAHIANSLRSMEMRFLKGQQWNKAEPNANGMSKEEIIGFLEDSFDEAMVTISALPEASLEEPGKNFGKPALTKEQSILFMFDHITNHRAKAVLYLRLNSIAPPRYGFN